MVLRVRSADYTDFDFIHGCLLYGARKGHYSVNITSEAALNCLKLEIDSVIQKQCLLDGRHAIAWIYELAGKRVATLILCDQEDGYPAYEIYALSVARKFQGRGYGNQALDYLMNQLPQAQLVARCSAQSSKLQHMLEKRGFRVNNTFNGFNILVRETLHLSDLSVPTYVSL